MNTTQFFMKKTFSIKCRMTLICYVTQDLNFSLLDL